MAGTHSRLSASGAPAYSLCIGKPNAEEGLPDETSFFAAEGTVFHEVAAWCLEMGMEPEDFLGMEFEEDGYHFTWDETFCKNMHNGLDYFRDLAAEGEMFVERRVSLEIPLGKGESGTCDVGIVIVTRREIIIGDWKYGAGVPVSPADPVYDSETGAVLGFQPNKQAALYAIGFWYDIARHLLGDPYDVVVRLVIEQPRSEGGGGEYYTTMEDLLLVGEELGEIAKKTLDPNAPRTAGEKQCQFCKRRKAPGGCSEFTQFTFDLLQGAFDDMDTDIDLGALPFFVDPIELTPERRAYIARHSNMVDTFMKDNHRQVLDDALKGRPTPGMKAVYGRSPPRKWKALVEADAEKTLKRLLGDRAFKQELISPTRAEELLTEKQFGTLIAKFVDAGEPKPTLAPLTAKKPAIAPYQDLFSDEDLL